jgi:hypothetical protein
MDGSITKIIKMKMISHNLKHNYIYAIVLLLSNFTALFAQDLPVFDETIDDNTAAPIDNYVLPMLVLAIIIGAVLIRKKSITCLK